MSFDVFLQRFENGQLASVNRKRVRDVVRTASCRGPDDFGFYLIAFPDGAEVELAAKDLEGDKPFVGCAFFIRGFPKALPEFIYRIACAGDMIIMPAMEGAPLIFVSEDQRVHVPADFMERMHPVLVNSSEELGALLTGGFEGWSTYRNQVVRDMRSREA